MNSKSGLSDGALGYLFAIAVTLSGCHGTSGEAPVNTDYSALKVADPQDTVLTPASESDLTQLLKNGVRLSLRDPVYSIAGATTADPSSTHSDTTIQVTGVDEGDRMKYDGQYMYALVPDSPSTPLPVEPGGGAATTLAVNPLALKVIRTDPATAQMDTVSRFALPKTQALNPALYLLDETGSTRFVAAISQTISNIFPVSFAPGPATQSKPNRVIVNLLDVSTPTNVSTAWTLEVDGYLRTTRKIGDTLYLITAFSPVLPALNLNAQSDIDRQSNERKIASTRINDLLPRVSNAGAESVLLRAADCLVPLQNKSTDGFKELTVVTAIDLRAHRVTDAKCLSAGENGVYVSTDTAYLGGTVQKDGVPTTVLHKLGLASGGIGYRATGSVDGSIPWSNSSYFLDEYRGDLRIVTSTMSATRTANRLSVLREGAGQRLQLVASLPSAAHPDPLGAGEQLQAVRFAGDRGYVVTFRRIDPLYVLDLTDAADPHIAGALHIAGFSTFLFPFGTDYLLGVGQSADSTAPGVKVELFDVTDMTNPRSVAAYSFGRSWSDALWDPHALTVQNLTNPSRQRIAMHLDVLATPLSINPATFGLTYNGLHLFEIGGLDTHAPDFQFHGVLKADDGTRTYPALIRSALNDDSVFYIYGERNISSSWQNVPAP